jgi:hypothetical protein
MNCIPASITDLAVIRRAIFASNYLPKECPNYWSIVTAFATQDSQICKDIDDSTIKATIENLQLINPAAFYTDCKLIEEIHAVYRIRDEPLGIVLISPNSECGECHSKLLIRKDRPSHVIVYTESYGTIAGTHYHKYCSRRGCTFRQYYGYHSNGDHSVIFYDINWIQMEYFISSSETAFELKMLSKFDAELLLGQISYSQKASIYNYTNNYEIPRKTCSFIKKSDASPKQR